ncbi:unnamed protein product, partial [Enterobius vermicularis]|uniref:Kinesin motor domain-containing protein n=1 Tax=Enterobius vermicularis TaxID=51028 RepID=A0A0N4VEW4_ENTVE
ALPASQARCSPSEQFNSVSSSPRCSPNTSGRDSGAGSPRGLLVYDFVNEGSSGELDSACRNAALEESH